ncbi:MAG: CRISPR-associated endoribonuclease Cas6 [Clostridioides sp.]|jgi:CRISPR-associated endoribonuclease Cas6|nr:CRISPR-associated endoribonuclease Cas6 [Clostridioides sp.]
MRFSLEVKLENNIIPKDYRRSILSLIKKSLSEFAEGKCFDKFFKDTIEKDFCFSVCLKVDKFEKESIVLKENKFYINVTTSDEGNIGYILAQSLLKQKNHKFSIHKNSFTIERINMKKSKMIKGNSAIFKVFDLVVRDHNKEKNIDRYFTFDEVGFSERLYEIVRQKALKHNISEEKIKNFKITPIRCKKIIVLNYGINIPVTTGEVLIEADNEILKLLYDTGIGSKSVCFGYLELLAEI